MTFKNLNFIGTGSLAQLNRASDYGSEGYRFESCRSHKNQGNQFDSLFLFSATKHQPPPVKLSKFSGQPYFWSSGKILGDRNKNIKKQPFSDASASHQVSAMLLAAYLFRAMR